MVVLTFSSDEELRRWMQEHGCADPFGILSLFKDGMVVGAYDPIVAGGYRVEVHHPEILCLEEEGR